MGLQGQVDMTASIHRRRGWELPESETTPEALFLNRRAVLAGMAGAGIAAALPARAQRAGAAAADPTADLYPAQRNERYVLDRPLTAESDATSYNNFYEFGTSKGIFRQAQRLPLRPWQVRIEGMVKEPRTVDIDTLIRAMPLEERLYRHRCVEAWSMAVPWTGFPIAKLLAWAEPLGSAKYMVMQTFGERDIAGGLSVATGMREPWYPWPYVEGLTIEEANNELAFMATGLYGKPLGAQNGAPLRLAVPWKYGFKSVKSIVRIAFTDRRPKTFWEEIQPSEYGFWANVNPEVAHPRWSQASERVLTTGERRATLLFNGYAEQVAGLYQGMTNERLYA
jgi:sulfoxide reductase catalytic subunit YedY